MEQIQTYTKEDLILKINDVLSNIVNENYTYVIDDMKLDKSFNWLDIEKAFLLDSELISLNISIKGIRART